jgi:hypothetical protein
MLNSLMQTIALLVYHPSLLSNRHLDHLDTSPALGPTDLLILGGNHHQLRVCSNDLEAVTGVTPDFLGFVEGLEIMCGQVIICKGEQLEAGSLGLEEEGVRRKYSLDGPGEVPADL